MAENLVKEYYAGCIRREWRRLISDPYHRLELDTTLHFLEKYLPGKGLILDAGGGPGRYAIELASRGYDVVLQDLTAANLRFARRQIKKARIQNKVKEVAEGSITDLSRFADETFDAVVCLGGPLSHVLDKCERDKAISEMVRVARKGAPVVASVMGRLSVLIVELAMFQHEIELPHFKQMRDTGNYLGGYGFTPCHFFLPEELEGAFTRSNVEILEMVGLEGISSHHRKELNRLAKDEKRWETWIETHYGTCTHPAIVGISEHILIICRKA